MYYNLILIVFDFVLSYSIAQLEIMYTYENPEKFQFHIRDSKYQKALDDQSSYQFTKYIF